MTHDEVEAALDRAEAALVRDEGLAGTGFWKAVAAAKRDRAIAEEVAGRVGAIDRGAFENWALITVPATVGTVLMTVGTLGGLALVWWAYSADSPLNGFLLLAGTVVTLVTTHGLAHAVVAAAGGMKVSHWFIGTLKRPQPGVKIDYSTYLLAPAVARARMHAAGAVMSKLVPFFALAPAVVMDAPAWTVWVLLILGIGQIVTDVLWSTKASDWKKYRREMAYR